MSTREERIATINSPATALAALREIADIGRVFNAEMAAMVSKAADVLETAIDPASRVVCGDVAPVPIGGGVPVTCALNAGHAGPHCEGTDQYPLFWLKPPGPLADKYPDRARACTCPNDPPFMARVAPDCPVHAPNRACGCPTQYPCDCPGNYK